jgi:predicted enzyme related to lactoylglutathione lyase
MNHIIYIEIPTTDLKNAESFFSKIFGWQFEPMANMPGIRVLKNPGEGPGALIVKTKSVPKKTALRVHIEVTNIDEKLTAIKKVKGTSVQAKTLIPGQGWYANFSTPDGCPFALWQTLLRAA